MNRRFQILRLGHAPKTYGIKSPYQFARVKHRADRGDAMVLYPDAIVLQDRPIGSQEGHKIPITASLWRFLERLNRDNAGAWKWLTTWEAMWINKTGEPSEIGDIDITGRVNAVCMIGGGNLIAYDDETETHVKIVSYSYLTNFDMVVETFYTAPWLFWFPTAINKAGRVYKVNNGIDVFIPLIKYTELWIRKSEITLLARQPLAWKIEDVMRV